MDLVVDIFKALFGLVVLASSAVFSLLVLMALVKYVFG